MLVKFIANSSARFVIVMRKVAIGNLHKSHKKQLLEKVLQQLAKFFDSLFCDVPGK